MAGVSRQQYVSDIKIVRVMCTGRVDLAFIFRALLNGKDGVFIGGCWPGECHYLTQGNYGALSTMHIGRKLLEMIGLSPDRLRLDYLSASEGSRYAEVMNDFSTQVKALGPLGRGEGIDEADLRRKLEVVYNLVPYIKLVERERLRVPVRSIEAYNAFFDSDEFDKIFQDLVADKVELSQITEIPHENPCSAGEISEIIDKYPSDPSSLIQVLIDIQNEFRWIPKAALSAVSKKLNVPMNRIQHIITFYKAFSMVPKGRHEIHVCTGTACHVRGATRLLNAVEAHTGIKPGETDQDLQYNLETVNCVGCCALGPVMVIDGEYHGNMASAKAEEVLKSYE